MLKRSACLLFLSLLAFLAACRSQPVPAALTAASPSISTAAAPVPDCPEIRQGLSFLEARYNPTIGLLNESPTAAPHTYWLTNDNALAAFAYNRLGQPEKSDALKETLRHYGRGSNGLLEVLWGETVLFPPYTARVEQIAQIGEDIIQQELHTSGPRFDDWADYADLAFYAALNAFHQGRGSEALEIFASNMKKFDGVGFRDKAFVDQYETYKLALALTVGASIHADAPNAGELRAALIDMQRPDGGFITHYRALNQPSGDANTETTSLALLALWEGCH